MNSSLYRSYVRLLEKWPSDTTKKSRDLGEFIRRCVAVNFKFSDPQNPVKCEKIHNILSDIAGDRFNKHYFVPESGKSSATGRSLEECNQIMSDDFKEAMLEQEKSLTEKIFKRKSN